MTQDQAEAIAVQMGALKPQGMMERMAAGTMAYQNRGRFADTPLARSRLQAWTQDVMRGVDPRNGRPLA